MRFILALFITCLLAPELVSCKQVYKPTRELGYAGVLPITFEGIDPSLLEWDNPEEQEFEKNAPLVTVEARVLKVEPGFAMRVQGERTLPFEKLSRKEMEKLLKEEAGFREVRQLSPPRVTAYSGQLTHTLVVTQAAYIQDYTMGPKEDGSDRLEPEPKIGTLNTGTVVKVRPVVDGKEIEIQDFDAVLAERLGERTCQAVIVQKGETWGIVWTEPVLLVAKPDPKLPKVLRLKEDDALIVPMHYQVKQASANARAFAAKGSIHETFDHSIDLGEGQVSPLNMECVVLLTARGLSAEEKKSLDKSFR